MTTVAITGANRGIGLALTRIYLARGDRVIGLCRSPDKADVLKQLATEYPGKVAIAQIDIGDEKSIAAAGRSIDEPIDILINNAGIFPSEDQTFENADVDAWMNAFKVMVIGPVLTTRAFTPHLEKTGGKVGVVSSVLGSSVWPFGGSYAYSTAKAASTRSATIMGIDLKEKGISVVALHPGYVATDMGGPDAPVKPEDSAAGCIAALDKLTLETSGGFVQWTGEDQPY